MRADASEITSKEVRSDDPVVFVQYYVAESAEIPPPEVASARVTLTFVQGVPGPVRSLRAPVGRKPVRLF